MNERAHVINIIVPVGQALHASHIIGRAFVDGYRQFVELGLALQLCGVGVGFCEA